MLIAPLSLSIPCDTQTLQPRLNCQNPFHITCSNKQTMLRTEFAHLIQSLKQHVKSETYEAYSVVAISKSTQRNIKNLTL